MKNRRSAKRELRYKSASLVVKRNSSEPVKQERLVVKLRYCNEQSGDGVLRCRTYTVVVLVVAAGCVHTSGLISIPKPGNSGTRTAPSLGIMGLFSMVGQVDS